MIWYKQWKHFYIFSDKMENILIVLFQAKKDEISFKTEENNGCLFLCNNKMPLHNQQPHCFFVHQQNDISWTLNLPFIFVLFMGISICNFSCLPHVIFQILHK